MTDQGQSGCDPSSVLRTVPEKAGRRIGRWLRLTSFMLVVLPRSTRSPGGRGPSALRSAYGPAVPLCTSAIARD